MQSLSIIPAIYVIGVYNYIKHFYPKGQNYEWLLILLLFSVKAVSGLLIFYFNGNKSLWKPTKKYSEIENELD